MPMRKWIDLFEKRDDLLAPSAGAINPALLTTAEYERLVDPKEKCHPREAYDMSLAKLSSFHKKDDYPHYLRRTKLHGLWFEFRLRLTPRRYAMFGPDQEYLRDEAGKILYYSDEEARALGLRPYDRMVAVFDEQGRCCGYMDDNEWGCMLVVVAREYRSLGLGRLLHMMARKMEPSLPSGGFTPQGRASFQNVHRQFVRDALASGLYSRLVRSGQMTMERVREIVASVRGVKEPQQSVRDLNTNDPSQWLLYVSGYGDFVLYDRKLKDFIEDGWDANEFWIDNAVKGLAYAGNNFNRSPLLLYQFGGDTAAIRRFMMSLVIEYAQREGLDLYVDPSDVGSVPKEYGTVSDDRYGNWYRVIPTGKRLNYDELGLVERAFRKKFDRYGEFVDHLVSTAYAKFRS